MQQHGANGGIDWQLGFGFSTRCVHGGHRPGPSSKGVCLPIERSATFLLDETAYELRAAGRYEEARVYARESGPTLEAVERKLAALEGSERACLFASGQGALAALVLAHVPPGAPVMLQRTVYGGTQALLQHLLPRQGSDLVRFDGRDAADLERQWASGAALVVAESLANPTLEVADLVGLASVARANGARLAVDATFATPLGQRPLELGADLVWHSATKALGGHSDLIAGVVAGPAPLLDPVRRWRTEAGSTPDPQMAWLLDRGLKTLALRVRAMSANAVQLARYLGAQPDVVAVLHPSLPRDDGERRRAAQLQLPGGMLSFVLRGGDARATRFASELRLIVEAASLGGVESLVSVPARMSHVGLDAAQRLAAGIAPGLVRLSVGIEDAADLEADLFGALTRSA
ncbi:MAG: cystathionine gamma-synthase [Planctomycetaceae bacterium]|nr:cystathionine gamma-synthase [Planctomycetaceae bacterium]